jgi:hypothetical protein
MAGRGLAVAAAQPCRCCAVVAVDAVPDDESVTVTLLQ